jgi:hypothetical protein
MQLDVIIESKKLLSQSIKPRPYYYDKLSLALATQQIVVIQ